MRCSSFIIVWRVLVLGILLTCFATRVAAWHHLYNSTQQYHGSLQGNARGKPENSFVTDLQHHLPAVRQARQLQQALNAVDITPAIDPANSKGAAALNQQVCVDDTSAAPYNSIGFLKLSTDTDEGCAAVLLAENIIYTSSSCVNADNDYTKLVFYPGRSTCASSTLAAYPAGVYYAYFFTPETGGCTGSDELDDCHQIFSFSFAALNVSYPAFLPTLNFSAVSNPVPAGAINTAGYIGTSGVSHCDDTRCDMLQTACSFDQFNGSFIYSTFRCPTGYYGSGSPLWIYDKLGGERRIIGLQTSLQADKKTRFRVFQAPDYETFTQFQANLTSSS